MANATEIDAIVCPVDACSQIVAEDDFHDHMIADHVDNAPISQGRIKAWGCEECGDAYESQDEAEECCTPAD